MASKHLVNAKSFFLKLSVFPNGYNDYLALPHFVLVCVRHQIRKDHAAYSSRTTTLCYPLVSMSAPMSTPEYEFANSVDSVISEKLFH